MSEKILFNITPPGPYEEAAYEMLWFQGDNGLAWDATPIDTILVSALIIDPVSGKYEWDSVLADPARWHFIKSRSLDGTVSEIGIILSPRSITPQPNTGILLNNIEETPVYKLGDRVDLLFETDVDTAITIGNSVNVLIKDMFNNVITTVTAELIGGGMYSAEYTIPVNLKDFYNGGVLEAPTLNYFVMKDVWQLGVGTEMEFSFRVDKIIESPTEENCEIRVDISGILATDYSALGDTELRFTTVMSPWHCTVQDVIDTFRNSLEEWDVFEIARLVSGWSSIVDLHMKPNIIYYQDRFDLAARQYVQHMVAYEILQSSLTTGSEEKMLDTFRVAKTVNPDKFLQHLLDHAKRFALIIWAGGKDTPFVTKRFEKGLYDPNRPSVGRSQIDLRDNYPWVNYQVDSTKMMVEGNEVEIRGYRTVAYRFRPLNSVYAGERFSRPWE